MEIQQTEVVVVGCGPAGLALSACLSQHSISHLILEREDCHASLWKKRTYTRLNVHLAKEFCTLPFMPHPKTSSTFLSKDSFIEYLDRYVTNFNIKPLYNRCVESTIYDEVENRWWIEAKNTLSGEIEKFNAKFLVVASGENSKGYIPEILGLDTFEGEIIHSNEYKSAPKFTNKEVLVVGCGNSGMEIAHDLSAHGVLTSIVIRNPIHVVTKEMVHLGMLLLKYLPIWLVDFLVTFMSICYFGNLSKYGIHRPSKGPFYIKETTGRSPVLDVGATDNIKQGKIKVVPEISSIYKNIVRFVNGMEKEFDAIIFATGYRSVANNWLKDYRYIFNEDSMPKNKFPHHWKGENNVYCAGLSRRGLFGVSMDAKAIADDIKVAIQNSSTH